MMVNVITGAILVFLPGYDEIVSLRDRITEDKKFSDSGRCVKGFFIISLCQCMSFCCINVSLFV